MKIKYKDFFLKFKDSVKKAEVKYPLLLHGRSFHITPNEVSVCSMRGKLSLSQIIKGYEEFYDVTLLENGKYLFRAKI